jgi:hypothetical protein
VSTWYSAEVSCPACGHRFEARFLRGANATRAPALRDAALAGTLNRVACPACGRVHAADATLVYADPPRGHWVTVAPAHELASWAALEHSCLVSLRTTLETSVATSFASAMVRLVFDVDELREKLAIWDAGLDDGVVECVKLSCLRERPGIRGPGARLRVTAIDAAGLEMAAIAAERPGDRAAAWRVPRAVVADVAADLRWREQLPALFAPGFVSIDRYLR